MRANPWNRLATAAPSTPGPWLEPMLARNARTAYLSAYGSPRSMDDFRERVPIVSYEELTPWLDRVCNGESDILFAGFPIAFERTGGSTGAAKLIPYSAEGLRDFQSAVVPWLSGVGNKHGFTGPAYF